MIQRIENGLGNIKYPGIADMHGAQKVAGFCRTGWVKVPQQRCVDRFGLRRNRGPHNQNRKKCGKV